MPRGAALVCLVARARSPAPSWGGRTARGGKRPASLHGLPALASVRGKRRTAGGIRRNPRACASFMYEGIVSGRNGPVGALKPRTGSSGHIYGWIAGSSHPVVDRPDAGADLRHYIYWHLVRLPASYLSLASGHGLRAVCRGRGEPDSVRAARLGRQCAGVRHAVHGGRVRGHTRHLEPSRPGVAVARLCRVLRRHHGGALVLLLRRPQLAGARLCAQYRLWRFALRGRLAHADGGHRPADRHRAVCRAAGVRAAFPAPHLVEHRRARAQRAACFRRFPVLAVVAAIACRVQRGAGDYAAAGDCRRHHRRGAA
ncbi:hypothetical protein D3C71_1222900 [compost metagenome]